MANIFTSNQVNHVYVAKSAPTSSKLTSASAEGAVYVGTANGAKYLSHMGKGGLTRSDLLTNIMSINATPASKMAYTLKKATVTLNADALYNSDPIVGQDYILRIEFMNPIGMSMDNRYWKYGVVHVTSGMTASGFYEAMKDSLEKNLSREAVTLVDVALVGTQSSYTGLTITEHYTDDWIPGVRQDKPVVFTVTTDEIDNGADQVIWGDVTTGNSTTTIANGHLAADLEYFAMGERADLYRGMGWPDIRPTKYLVDPTKEYDMVTVHYAYTGANHSVQKSEKDLTILCERASTDTDATKVGAVAKAVANAIVSGTVA